MASKKKKGAQASAKDMKPFYIVLGAVAVLGIGGILYSMNRGGTGDMATAPIDMSQIANADSLVERARGVSVGADDAPVQMIVFSDYQCPGCKFWTGQLEPLLKQEFVETGKIRYTYYDFPLVSIHPHAFLAARAGRCADDQGRFWDWHDRTFAAQEVWAYSQASPVTEFTQYAADAGLDTDAFVSCMRSDRHADVVTANLLLGERLGVRGTPTVYVNGRRLGDREWNDYNAIRAMIEAAGGV